MVFSVAWLVVLVVLPLMAQAVDVPKPDCSSKCGEVGIDFPFGIGPDCYLNENFSVSCHNDVATLVKANKNGLTLSKIRLTDHQVLLQTNAIAYDCSYGAQRKVSEGVSINFEEPFTVSRRWNRFRAMGCDTSANISKEDGSFMSSCDTQWTLDKTGKKHGGLGECEIAVPENSHGFSYNVTNRFDYTKSACDLNCSFAFLVEDAFQFNQSMVDIYNVSCGNNDTYKHPLPLVVEWEITGSCHKNDKCQGNNCIPSNSSTGYHCYCYDGFSGNPYLPEKEGGCRNGDSRFPTLPVALAGGFVLAATLGASSYSYGSWAQKKALTSAATKLLENLNNSPSPDDLSPPDYDPTSGGDTPYTPDVDDPGAGNETGSNSNDFNKEDLRKAIKDLQKGRRIARLISRSRVFKAMLGNHGLVQIRKYSIQEKSQLKPFMNVVHILSRRVVHANVARLLGISTRENSLIYKHFSDQTLFDHLHRSSTQALSWEARLNIATGTARGLAFVHSRGIFHRNVKSSSILLDKKCMPQVVDFGVARLSRRQTLLNSSRGYVDPDFLNMSIKQLAAKSDVYSFGVVLVELLTGKDPSSKGSNREQGNILAMEFVSMLEEDRLDQVVDKRIWVQESIEKLKAVALVAKKCLQLNGKDRPTMLKVRDELVLIKGGQPLRTNQGGNAGGSQAGQNDDVMGRSVDQFQNFQDKILALTDAGDDDAV